MKQVVDYALEVEEISIAREAIDPSYPHEEGILQGVDEAEDYHHLTFNIVEKESIVEADCEKLEVKIEKSWIVQEDDSKL